jgi:hypothetical protein
MGRNAWQSRKTHRRRELGFVAPGQPKSDRRSFLAPSSGKRFLCGCDRCTAGARGIIRARLGYTGQAADLVTASTGTNWPPWLRNGELTPSNLSAVRRRHKARRSGICLGGGARCDRGLSSERASFGNGWVYVRVSGAPMPPVADRYSPACTRMKSLSSRVLSRGLKAQDRV